MALLAKSIRQCHVLWFSWNHWGNGRSQLWEGLEQPARDGQGVRGVGPGSSFRNENIAKLGSKAKLKPMILEICLQADISKSLSRVIHFIF